MKTTQSSTAKVAKPAKTAKVFTQLTTQQLEAVVGGPIASRGTETTVQTQN